MVNSDDLEHLLGPRPFRSTELRNIDRFRDGFQKTVVEAETLLQDSDPAEEDPPTSGQTEEAPAAEDPVRRKGRIVAT